MNGLLVAAVAIPAVGAALGVVAGGSRRTQRVIALATVGAAVAVAVAILAVAIGGEPRSVAIGGWPAATGGIVLVADITSALFLLVSMLAIGSVLVFAIGQRAPDVDAPAFYPVYLVLTTGVSLAFLTGDLFTLFVAFEMLLVASYVLLTLGGRADQLRSAMTYVVINVLGGALFIAAIAFVYAATGSLNLAEIAARIEQLPSSTITPIALMLLAVFGVKAAVVPLSFWLPDSYPAAPTAVTAVFAGLLTKIGVYALIRVTTLLDLRQLAPLLLVVASVTMIIGVLGAIAQDDVKRILSFHIISQVGYMVFGLALLTTSGIAAAIFFTVHQIPIKTALFLTAGLIEERAGTSALRRVDGLARVAPAVAVLFALAAASLAGLPPFSGFVGKLALVEAGIGSGQYVPVVVSLVASVLTLVSMTKIWVQVFWGSPRVASVPTDRSRGEPVAGSRPLMVLTTGGIVGVTIAVAVFAGAVWGWSVDAAEQLTDPVAYVRAVAGADR